MRPNIQKHTGDIAITRKMPRILNLKRIRRLYVASSILGVFIILIAAGWFFYGYITRAEKAQFYPTSCLGGWQNPQNAEGKPDLAEDAELNKFTEANSAVLRNAISEIYCGGFEGKIPEETTPRRALLKLSWAVKLPSEEIQINQEPEINNQELNNGEQDSEIESQESEKDEGVSENNVDEPEIQSENKNNPENSPIEKTEEIQTSPEPSSDSEPGAEENIEGAEEPVSFWKKLITSAFAQEDESSAQTTNNTQESDNPTTETASDSNLQSSNALEIQAPALLPENDFLEILYTLDGLIWKRLAKVNHANWRNLIIEIPNFTWEDISKVQFSLRSLSIVDTPINIYLDGMWVEVDYGKEEIEEEPNEIEETSLIFGDLPDFDKENFKLNDLPTHSCALAPFRQNLSPKSKTKFKLSLKPTSSTRPYRLVLGDLPLGVKGNLKQIKGQDEIIVELSSSVDPQRGSFGVVIVYQELKKRKLLSANEVSTNVCQFNLIIH